MSNSSVPVSSPPFSSSVFSSASVFSSQAPSSSFVPPSSSVFVPSSSAPPSSTLALITSVVTQSPSSPGGSAGPATIIITSTTAVTSSTPQAPPPASSTSSSTSSKAAALATSSASASKSSSGLSAGGKIAVATVVPIAAIALIVLALLFLWRKRKARKNAEEQRKKEIEEYGFNPNNDPTLPAVGASSFGDEPPEMREEGAGYRGWGTTSTQRKPSTTLSGSRGIGMAVSDGGSNPGGYNQTGSPTEGTGPNSEAHSSEPLVGSPKQGRPITGDSETIGALGAPPLASGSRQDRDIHRGPSNASSAYSGANRSDGSEDVPLPGAPSGPNYYEDGPYYSDAQPQHGPYGDGTYGGSGQPVIRDVQARRNTRIEKPSVFPQQGNAGIAQNF